MTAYRRGATLLVAGVVGVLAGCSQQVPGHPSAAAAGCGPGGYTAAAATATVRCYLDALGAGDTDTACSLLSENAREHVVASARADGGDFDSVLSPTSQPAGCGNVAPLMRKALDALPAGARAQFRAGIAAARVGPASVMGSRATVAVTATFEGRTGTDDATLLRSGGAWKIDSGNAFTING